MPIPASLARAVDISLVRMRERLDHHLDRSQRLAIYAALGPRLDRSRPGGDVGMRRRAALDQLAALRVLPLWQKSFPEEPLAQELIEEARNAVHQILPKEEIVRVLGYTWGQLESLAGDDMRCLAGFAAFQALYRALNDVGFDSDHIDADLTDERVGIYGMDAGLLAASAAAGGYPWMTASDPNERLAFWEWWLLEAVPQAWESVPEPGEQ